ncbi:PilZ domain-containing protein [Pseudomonas syringae]|uniref:PilZ domain-containing protein n=1 Tax=Pseudomonas syringae TaxID=317 RepID=A0A9Q4FH89_PSESX|nr:PilZ domain-containing protein [Pseudomonas syringae]MCF5468757.1 PilZ domain-containing protein [Pseudomonas syringae]MCF5475031.1 PilZ domain-containing protein [Pseudomonas syringae]MCF5485047.1 PilZ domain-containing protein [Pseudomonas syringae]MCF5488587.1 PilZ domain-containing protein [Pseudomonas syringae]MCF5495781.1 PilZ domain-containing protein [Pseudomonas syringae]
MYKERRIERHQLHDYLQVFNFHTGKPVGYLGNVSEDGLMLISHMPVLVGARFDLVLRMPFANGAEVIDVNALCLWCHEDETPGGYDSGFELSQVSTRYLGYVQMLRRYFSFYPSYEASA